VKKFNFITALLIAASIFFTGCVFNIADSAEDRKTEVSGGSTVVPDTSEKGKDAQKPESGDDRENPDTDGSGKTEPRDESGSGGEIPTDASITPLSFGGIRNAPDVTGGVSGFISGSADDGPKDEGMVVSPWFVVNVNDVTLSAYSVRTGVGDGLHSFAMADIGADAFPLSVSVYMNFSYVGGVAVLPESGGITTTRDGNTFFATINGYGNYTFVPNDDREHSITLIFRENESFGNEEYGFEVPDGYSVKNVSPGTHTERISFTQTKQVMVFKSGIHRVKYSINFLNDTAVYLERGAYLFASMPDPSDTSVESPTVMTDPDGYTRWNALFQADGKRNIAIYGRGIIEMSNLQWHARQAVHFDSCTDVKLSGITVNNSPLWNVLFSQCVGIDVSDVAIFGYRTNSDGICVMDSRDAEIRNCFARSGDDLFEVKSMVGSCHVTIGNIFFRNCNAWPDKARGFGVIAENVRDINDVHFVDCSVGFDSAAWDNFILGSLAVYLINSSSVSNIYFENIEIHYSAMNSVNITLENGSSSYISGIRFTNVRLPVNKKILVAKRNSSVGGNISDVVFTDCTRGGIPIQKSGEYFHGSGSFAYMYQSAVTVAG